MTQDAKHIYGFWFIPSAAGNRDWFGGLYIDADDKWTFRYRFRYYSPESTDVNDGKDHKNWYMAKMNQRPDAFQAALDAINLLMPTIERDFGCKADFVLLDCPNGDPKILFELGSRPWAHPTLLTEEE